VDEGRAGQPVPTAAYVLIGAGGALSISVLAGAAQEIVAPLAIVVAGLAVAHRMLLRWDVLLGVIVIVILFVSIKRYELPASLPFNLELYRVLVASVILLWVLSLLIDPRVRLGRSDFDAPLALVVAAIFASELANRASVQSLSSYVWKSLTFALSFLLVYYFTVSVIRRRRQIDVLLGVLVSGGALVAAAGIVERRIGYNVFDHLAGILPFLDFAGEKILGRGGRLRVFASAQHPIALGGLFAILIPIGFALGFRRGRAWWVPTGLLALGVMATASRTPIVMLAASAGALLWLKPKDTKRLIPFLVPAIVVVHVALPGALGSFRNAFFPAGGLVAEQSAIPENADPLLAGGRIRLLSPSLELWAERPLFGQGYGTRVTGFDEENRNAPILDNQWLGSLLEIGLLGVAAWVWLLVRAVRRLGRAARDGPEDDAWLYVGFAAAIVGFAVGMFTYDTFTFIQVTFIFWIILGLGAAALGLRAGDELRDSTEGFPDPTR